MKNCTYKDTLKKSGLKNTKHRTAVIEILAQSSQPISAEEIYFMLKESKVDINLSTIYRTLEVFAANDIVTKLNLTGSSKALYEYNMMTHRHYLICIKCKKIVTIEHCPLQDYEALLEKHTDFSIVGHKLDIYGYCPECKS